MAAGVVVATAESAKCSTKLLVPPSDTSRIVRPSGVCGSGQRTKAL